MEKYSQAIRIIKRKNPFDCYYRLLSTLEKIMGNIVAEPQNEKFYKISAKIGGKLDRDILQTNGGQELLVDLGFTRHVEDFQPFFIRKDKLIGRNLHMFKDVHELFTNEILQLEARKSSSEVVKKIEKIKDIINKDVTNIMMHYEEDRLEKEEIANREHERIRKAQKKRDDELKEKIRLQRLEMERKKEYDRTHRNENAFSFPSVELGYTEGEGSTGDNLDFVDDED